MFALRMYVIDVKPIPPRNKNNREVHLDCLKHLKESVATLREIVEEARVEKPSIAHLHLLVVTLNTLRNWKKQVTFIDPCETSTNNTLTHVKQQTMHQTNELVIPSTGVKDATAASGSKPRSNTKKDRTLPAKTDMQKVEVHHRNNKSSVKRKNRVDSSISYKRTVISSNSTSVFKTYNKCLMFVNHDKCVVKSVKSVTQPLVKKVWQIKQVKQVWQASEKLFGHQWRPTGRKFTLGEQCPLTRITISKVVPVNQVTPPLDKSVTHVTCANQQDPNRN
uniref:Uncharacterized protein n=1 Tax=Tanacetum cinerariifolium TaxID=118510 RepID=A0A699HL96_TANCI|nr:hypothetical protein [Tanacetum cinerariifolium]GEY98347.1 hypothetical protein [Tanacetum cinerariifolium]